VIGNRFKTSSRYATDSEIQEHSVHIICHLQNALFKFFCKGSDWLKEFLVYFTLSGCAVTSTCNLTSRAERSNHDPKS